MHGLLLFDKYAAMSVFGHSLLAGVAGARKKTIASEIFHGLRRFFQCLMSRRRPRPSSLHLRLHLIHAEPFPARYVLLSVACRKHAEQNIDEDLSN